MKKSFAIFLAILMFASLPLACPAAEEKMVEYAKNGGFEELETDVKAANWGLDPGFEWGKDAILDTTNPYEGKYALRTKADGLQFAQGIAVIAGKEYTLSFYARADQVGARTRIGFEVTGGAYKFESHWLEFTSEWTHYEYKYVPGDDVTRISLRAVIGKGNDIMWDAISFKAADSPEFIQNVKTPALDGAENMVTNGGFEEFGADGFSVNWAPRKSATQTGEQNLWIDNPMAAIDKEVAHSGEYSLKLTHGEEGTAYARAKKPIKINPDMSYQISGWVRSNTHRRAMQSTTFWFRWEFWSSEEMTVDSFIGAGGTKCVAPLEFGRWEQVAKTFRPSYKSTFEEGKDVYLQLYFYLMAPKGTPSLFIDGTSTARITGTMGA